MHHQQRRALPTDLQGGVVIYQRAGIVSLADSQFRSGEERWDVPGIYP